MSLLRKVFSDSAFSALRTLVSIVRGLAVIPIITNLLGASSYGVWVTVIASIGLIRATGGLHLHGSLVRFSSKESDRNQTFSDVLLLGTLIAVILSTGVFVVSLAVGPAQYLGLRIPDSGTFAGLLALLLFSTLLLQITLNYPRAHGNVRLYEMVRLSRKGLEAVSLLVVFGLGAGLLAGFAVLSGVALVLNVILLSWVFLRREVPLPDPANFKQYVVYGLPMVPKELSRTLLADSDKYLLLLFLGPASVGIYTVAEKVCRPMVKLTGIFNSTLYPRIAAAWDEDDFSEIAEVYSNIFRYYSIIGIPAMTGVVVLAEPLLTAFSTPNIAKQGAYLVPVFIGGYFLRGYDNPVRYVLTSAERTEIIGGAVVTAVLLNIGLNVVLIPRYGMFGAASATGLALLVLVGIVFAFSYQHIALPFPWLTVGRASTASLVMGATLHYAFPPLGTYTKLGVYPVVGCVLYFSVLFILGEFSEQELKTARLFVESTAEKIVQAG